MCMLLLSVICFNIASQANAECSDQPYGRLCRIAGGNRETVQILDNKLFVGAENALQVFSLPTLQLAQSIHLNSSEDTVVTCTGFGTGQFGVNAEDCKNFVRTIHPYQEGSIMVCGTNAYQPECNIHQSSSPSTYRKLSGSGEIDTGFSPFSSTHPIESILASNGNFFSATRFDNTGLLRIRMAPGAMMNDTSFTVGTPQDDRWLNTPTFVSVHEYGEHIYFFMTEPALELKDVEKVKYSRVIRICKSDVGVTGTDPRSNHFLTFQKARIVCSVDNNGGGSIPFFYNTLVSTFFTHAEGEDPVLYGAFNSPINGPAGGAICKFSFDTTTSTTITSIFEDGNYLVNRVGSIWVKETAPTFSCPGSQTGNQRTPMDGLTLKFNSITPTQNQPLYVSATEFLDKIATEMVQYMGATQEILYFTNQRGDIMQVVLLSGQQYQHTIFQPDSPSPVRNLILHHNNTARNLIATTDGQIIQIPRGQCSIYPDCFSCFDSKDAYCGWDQTLHNCVNKFEQSNLIQTFSASEANVIAVCGSRQPPTHPTEEPILPCPENPSTKSNTGEIVTTTDEKEEETEGKDDCTLDNQGLDNQGLGSSTGGLIGAESSNIGIPVVVGAGLGAFLIGLAVGSIACAIFCKRFARRSKSSKTYSSPEAPRENTALPLGNETVVTVQVNNNSEKKENFEKPKLQPPPPRYIQHNPNSVKPAPAPPLAVTVSPPPTQTKLRLGSTSSLPPTYKHANGTAHPQELPEEEVEDNAFVDNDTLPPLRTFPGPSTMYGSLGRLKTGTSGISRKQIPGHKVPRGRTDSTTWLRQRSESLSSDISSNTSPLESPISDV